MAMEIAPMNKKKEFAGLRNHQRFCFLILGIKDFFQESEQNHQRICADSWDQQGLLLEFEQNHQRICADSWDQQGLLPRI
jgi:hypothetical protein